MENNLKSCSKKLISLILSMLMVLSIVPVSVFAAENPLCENIIMNVGADETKRYVSWTSDSNAVGNLKIASADAPESVTTLTAEANQSQGKTGLQYYYHCEITGLESGKSYTYQVGGDSQAGRTNIRLLPVLPGTIRFHLSQQGIHRLTATAPEKTGRPA